MPKTRVLIVDDSVVIRRLLTDALEKDPGIQVAGAAADGRIALQKITQVNPDLVTLDVEMPHMNGLEALAEIRKSYPKLPVIMFSTLTERGAEATLDALALGTTDYVTKPANVGSVSAAIARIQSDLIPKIKVYCSHGQPITGLTAGRLPARPATPSVAPAQAQPKAPAMARLPQRVEIVAIGISTGGPNALAEMLPVFPPGFPVPMVIVQHMPPVFTKFLAQRLGAKSNLHVEEGRPGEVLQAGSTWVAPGDYHMLVEKSGTVVRLKMNQGPPENSCRPAVDPLFRSVVESYGSRCLCVVMTGMGQDGLRGCEHVREAGGQIFVQDEATSVVWGMPGFVANAGLADRVLPLGQLGAEIVRRVTDGQLYRA